MDFHMAFCDSIDHEHQQLTLWQHGPQKLSRSSGAVQAKDINMISRGNIDHGPPHGLQW